MLTRREFEISQFMTLNPSLEKKRWILTIVEELHEMVGDGSEASI